MVIFDQTHLEVFNNLVKDRIRSLTGRKITQSNCRELSARLAGRNSYAHLCADLKAGPVTVPDSISDSGITDLLYHKHKISLDRGQIAELDSFLSILSLNLRTLATEIADAVETQEEIKQIAELLEKHKGAIHRDIWVFGVSTALRITELLYITMEMALTGIVSINKRQGPKVIPLNKAAMTIVKARAKANPTHEFLFQSNSNKAIKNRNNKKNQPITSLAVSRSFREVGDILGLKLATYSMRKTALICSLSDFTWQKLHENHALEHNQSDLTHYYLAVNPR